MLGNANLRIQKRFGSSSDLSTLTRLAHEYITSDSQLRRVIGPALADVFQPLTRAAQETARNRSCAPQLQEIGRRFAAVATGVLSATIYPVHVVLAKELYEASVIVREAATQGQLFTGADNPQVTSAALETTKEILSIINRQIRSRTPPYDGFTTDAQSLFNLATQHKSRFTSLAISDMEVVPLDVESLEAMVSVSVSR